VAQVFNSYIIAESEEAMSVFDQHALHERLRFEKLRKEYETRTVSRQRLLFPVTLEIPAHRRGNLVESLDLFSAVGLDMEHFGDTTFVVRAVPEGVGLADVAGFARWACLIGPVGWDLAGSRFPMRLFWDPATSLLDGTTEMAFGAGLLAEIRSAGHLQANIAAAREALALAQGLGDPACLAESQVVLNAYLFLAALKTIADALRQPLPPSAGQPLAAGLPAALAALDAAAEAIVVGLWAWGCLVYPPTPRQPPHRLEETMSVFAQVVTEAYRAASRLGVVDPRPAYRDRLLGGWTAADFPTPTATLRFDATDLLAGPGPYRVMFRFTGGAYGLDILAVSFREADAGGEREVARVAPKAYGYGDSPPPPHIGRYEAWNDVRLDLAEVKPGARYCVTAEVRGVPADAPAGRRTCNGAVLLRRAWA
jgi:hypothetical protein